MRKVEDALKYPTINQQIKAVGIGQVVLAFIYEVARNLQGFNVKENMSADQIEMFCEDFISEYGHESLADLKITFQRARLGRYGSAHSYIDSEQVMDWFSQFLVEKAKARERAHEAIKSKEREPVQAGGCITSDQFAALKAEIVKAEEPPTENT